MDRTFFPNHFLMILVGHHISTIRANKVRFLLPKYIRVSHFLHLRVIDLSLPFRVFYVRFDSSGDLFLGASAERHHITRRCVPVDNPKNPRLEVITDLFGMTRRFIAEPHRFG